jgi:hypothetical protein
MVRSGVSEALFAEMLEVAIAVCDEQAWSPEVLDCFESAGGEAVSAGCIDRLSKDQRDDFMKRLTEVMQRSYSATSPSSPAP